MLGGLHRHGGALEHELELIGNEDDEAEGKNDNQNGEQNDMENSNAKKHKKRLLKFNDTQGAKTLEKESNLNLATFDTELMIDPLFK